MAQTRLSPNLIGIDVLEGAVYSREVKVGHAHIGAFLVPSSTRGEAFHAMLIPGKSATQRPPMLITPADASGPLAGVALEERMGRDTSPDEAARKDLGNLLPSLLFQQYAGDAAGIPVEFLLRDSFLPCQVPGCKWMIGCSATRHPLPGQSGSGILQWAAPDAEDLHQQGSLARSVQFNKIPDTGFSGEALASVLRAPHWGHGAQWGLATSMRPEVAEDELRKAREWRMRSDPQYATFLQHMGEPRPMAYDSSTLARLEQQADAALKRLLQAQPEAEAPAVNETSANTASPRPRTRLRPC